MLHLMLHYETNSNSILIQICTKRIVESQKLSIEHYRYVINPTKYDITFFTTSSNTLTYQNTPTYIRLPVELCLLLIYIY